MKYLKEFCLLLSCVYNIGFAQTIISGKTLDNNKKPISFVNVILRNNTDANFLKGTTTDDNGDFELEIKEKGNYTIEISFVGYKKLQKSVKVDVQKSIDLKDIILTNSETILDEVVIKGTKQVIEHKNGALVFNVEKSPLQKGYNGIELLKNTPTVFIGIDDAVLIRNEEVTLMVNGRKSNLTGSDLTNYIASLQSENIKSIHLQTFASAITDGENSGGVINIILKENRRGYKSTIGSDYTFKSKKHNDVLMRTNFDYGSKLWSVYGSYRFSKVKRLDEIERNYDYFTEENQILTQVTNESLGFIKHTYQIGAVFDASKKDVFGVEFFGTNSTNPYIEKADIQAVQNDIVYENGGLTFQNTDVNNLYNTSFSYDRKIDSLGSSFKIIADYLKQDIKNENITSSLYSEDVFDESTTKNESEVTTNIFSSELALEKNTRIGFKIKSGVKFTQTKRFNDLISSDLLTDGTNINETNFSFNYNEQIYASYTSLSRKIDKFFVDIGLRYENTQIKRVDLIDEDIIEQSYSNWFPSGYFSYELSKHNSISFSYSKKINRPYFRNLNNYILKVNDFSYAIGNPNLQPENIDKYELSYKERKQSISLYYTKSKNSIVSYYYNEDAIVFHQYINGGEEQNLGIEYNYTGSLFSWWYVNGVGGIFQRKFTNEVGQHIFDWTTAGTFKLTNIFKLNTTTSIDVSGFYTSDYRNDYNKQYAYNAVDIVFKKSFLKHKLQTKIAFNDVFDILDYKNESQLLSVNRSYSNKPLTQSIQISLSYRLLDNNKKVKKKNSFKNDVRYRL